MLVMLPLALPLVLALSLELPVLPVLRSGRTLPLGFRLLMLLPFRRGTLTQAEPGNHTTQRATEEHAPEHTQRLAPR